ncbi:MAG: ATP-binding protein [Lachnospiraceae bacterium]|nr:ATP-binding protein [Lachnospiraceae bacterium]
MGIIVRSLVLSFMTGISCKLFFETLLSERRKWPGWVRHTEILAFTAGFMLIAVTPIPPYILQPVRVILVLFLITQFYYRTGIVKNLLSAVLFCGIYWLISVMLLSTAYLLPLSGTGELYDMMEIIVEVILLCLMMAFRIGFQKRARRLAGLRWEKFGFFSILVMVVVLAVSMVTWDGTTAENYAHFIVVAGLVILCVSIFYFVIWRLEKEEELQWMQLSRERVQNQMDMYHNMQKSYERQRRLLHDYSNQLQCIQEMLVHGGAEETLKYLSGLTGNLKKSVYYVNTNNMIVNVVLNRKYQDALEKGIVMTMSVNDLSGITISEEGIVTLLVNLLDNAVEACEKLVDHKVIQFKMVLEAEELILSVRNPVKEPVKIKDNRIVTSKHDKDLHGIGLLNVETVVRQNNGTSVLKCEDGWFYFAAMIPMAGSGVLPA